MSEPRTPQGEPGSGAPRRRRPRYRGTHPRTFEEKYKERAAGEHPEIAERVRARGQTPAGQHRPVLVEETLAALAPRPGERGVDLTLGWGGHAERLLERIRPGGTLLALDADPIELPKAEARLRSLGFGPAEFRARRTNFARLRSVLDEEGWEDGADFVLADLGVSSMQLDDPARGFGAKAGGALDMRMNPRRGLPASEWLARASAPALEAALREHADEPEAAPLARALAGRKIGTARELEEAVRAALGPRRGGEDLARTVRRVFQALRIAVNDEFGTLELLLRQLPACLRPGGRVAVISFHSGEDRRVKKALQAGRSAGLYAAVASEPIRATAEERRANPRAGPAKLRWGILAPKAAESGT